MGNIDQNQFQPIHTNNELRALQRNNVARNEAIPNAETQTKHSLSTYADDEKSWLETTADEERSKSTGFMLRLKLRWDEQYPEKNRVSNQNLRDNAARFKKELEMNVGSEKAQIESEEDTTLNNTHKWTTEMKVNLLKNEELGKKSRSKIYEENERSMGWYIQKLNNDCPNIKI